MKFLDFFSGIGGMRLGLEKAGHTCVGFCEFDPHARKSYKAMFNTEGGFESHDVRTINVGDLPRADLWCFGFPCQDISVAGKQKGLENGERSGLFFEIMRLLAGTREEDKPRWLLVENVKNLLSIGKGFDFLRLIVEMDAVGYDVEWQLFNTEKSYAVRNERSGEYTIVQGIPQHRERVYIVGRARNRGGREVLPISTTNGENLAKLQCIGSVGKMHQATAIYNGDGLARTLQAECGGGGAKTGLYTLPNDGEYP